MDDLAFEDKTGQEDLQISDNLVTELEEHPNQNVKKQFPSFMMPELSKQKKISKKNKNNVDIDMDDVYIDMGRRGALINIDVRKISDMDGIMKKSVMIPGFEKLQEIPTYEVSKQIARKERKKEREKSTGSNWFNLPAPEMTDELKKELQVLQMRSVLDPKQFYKKNTMKTLPKYFQVGRIVEAPADYYHSRLPMKERKKTIVEELLADSQFKKYNKKRYTEIIEERRKTSFKAHKHAKRLKNKKR